MADSKWQPNLNAKPFIPSSAAYVVRLPCCMRPLKIRRRGYLGRIIQGVLVGVLTITVIFNIVFIIDNSNKLRSGSNSLPNDGLDDGFVGQELLQERRTEKMGKHHVDIILTDVDSEGDKWLIQVVFIPQNMCNHC